MPARFITIQDRTTRSFVLPRSLGGAHVLSLPLHPLTRELIEHQLAPLGAKLVVAESPAGERDLMAIDLLSDVWMATLVSWISGVEPDTSLVPKLESATRMLLA